MLRTTTAIAALALLAPAAAAQDFSEIKLTADDGAARDFFGTSVAVSGGSVLVGAPGDGDLGFRSGSAYLFDSGGSQLRKLTASDGAARDRFGTSVALSGGTALIGALGASEGTAYVFASDGTETKLTPGGGVVAESFGRSVALSGGRALIGDPQSPPFPGGVAFLFDANGTETLLLPDDGNRDDFFGASVALSGERALVGAPLENDEATNTNDRGAAYLFDADGLLLRKITAADGAARDGFGTSVALSRGTALIGAPGDGDNGSDSGSAYVFDALGAQVQKLVASDGAAFDQFGTSVALSGNLALVGARDDDDKGSDSGSAYLFDARTGRELAKLTASDAAAGDRFGDAVALERGTAVIGAPGEGASAGAAYVYDLSPRWATSDGGDWDDAANWALFAPGTFGLDAFLNPDAGDQVVTGPGSLSEVGTLELGTGAGAVTLELQRTSVIAATGGVEIGANGTLAGAGTGLGGIKGGIEGDIRNEGTVDLSAVGVTGDIENAAGGTVTGTGVLTVGGDLTNEGSVETSGVTSFNVGGTVDNFGQFTISGGATFLLGALNNAAGGQISTGAGGTLTLLEDVTNAGDIATAAGSRTTILGNYTGPGSFSGGGTVEFFGNTVSTGASPALVSFDGDVVIDEATTIMELGGTEGGAFDAWDVDGTLALGGTLVLETILGFVPKAGDGFTLFSASGGITGDFDMVQFAPLDSGDWRTVRTATTYGF